MANSNLNTVGSSDLDTSITMSETLPYPDWIEPELDMDGIEEKLDSIHYSMETELPRKLDNAIQNYEYECIKYYASEIVRMAESAEELIVYMNQENKQNDSLNQAKDA
jgi:hypothetical protein